MISPLTINESSLRRLNQRIAFLSENLQGDLECSRNVLLMNCIHHQMQFGLNKSVCSDKWVFLVYWKVLYTEYVRIVSSHLSLQSYCHLTVTVIRQRFNKNLNNDDVSLSLQIMHGLYSLVNNQNYYTGDIHGDELNHVARWSNYTATRTIVYLQDKRIISRRL